MAEDEYEWIEMTRLLCLKAFVANFPEQCR